MGVVIALVIGLVVGAGVGFGFRGYIERKKSAALAATKAAAQRVVSKL